MKNFKLESIKHPQDGEGRYTFKKSITLQIADALWDIGTGTFITGFILFGVWVQFGFSATETYIAPVQAKELQIEVVLDESTPIEDDINLDHLGTMGIAIKNASKEFDVPVELLAGISRAESSEGTNFVNTYDYNCFNYWGIKPIGGIRADGSYLRCFNDEEAGARTAASLLKRLYINQGLDTPEKIVAKWVGKNYPENYPDWLEHVNYYYKK